VYSTPAASRCSPPCPALPSPHTCRARPVRSGLLCALRAIPRPRSSVSCASGSRRASTAAPRTFCRPAARALASPLASAAVGSSSPRANFLELRKAQVQLRGIHLLRTLANKECQGLQRISLDDQGEDVAVAVTVAVVAGTVFSGAGTGSSTVTVRAGGRGGAASS
jgi:hypothetical protein